MIATVTTPLMIVAGHKQIEQHSRAKRAIIAIERRGQWSHVEQVAYRNAARIVNRGLG